MADTESVASSDGVSWRGQRKFHSAIGKPGQAREAREAIRNSLCTINHYRCGPMSQPLDYENFLTKNRTFLENDAQRDILLFPRDDITEWVVNREERTTVSSVSAQALADARWLLTKEALRSYSAPNRILSFNYSKFGGDYGQLARNTVGEELPELVYEVDIKEDDQIDEGRTPTASVEGDILKEGFLLQASDSSIGVSFAKAFKKRYCILRKREDILELEVYKDKDNRSVIHSKLSVAEVLKGGPKKGKPTIEVFTSITGNSPSYLFSADTEGELDEWQRVASSSIHSRSDRSSTPNGTDMETASTGSGAADAESLHSEDSRTDTRSISSMTSLGQLGRRTQKALTPPKTIRRDLFGLYPELELLKEEVGGSSFFQTLDRSPLSPTKEEPGVKFLVECRSLTVKVPLHKGTGETFEQIEPFFVRLYLLDGKTSRRVSEEFSLDVNPDNLRSMLVNDHDSSPSAPPLRGVDASWLTMKGRKALFSVSRPHAELYLVARVERVLGNPGLDAYLKNDTKASHKLEKVVGTACKKLGKYRTAFAWAARPVFQEFLGSAKESLPLYKCDPSKATDQDLLKFISDLAKLSDKSGKLQVLPGASICLSLDLSVKGDELPNKVTAGYLPLKPFPAPPPSVPVFEVQSFSPEDAAVSDNRPHNRYMNQLYVYPGALKYDGQKNFPKARNIVCWIQIKDEDTLAAPPLQLIFSRFDSGMKVDPYVSRVSCAVNHHDNCPSFAAEEVKVALPVNLTNKHHILFSFGHVAMSGALSTKPTSPGLSPESPCGYAWFPLVTGDGNRLNFEREDEKDLLLPVSSDLPDGYLSCKALGLGKGYSGPDIHWVEGGNRIFRFRLRLISSVFTPEPRIQKFFQACQRMERVGTLGEVAKGERDVKVQNGSYTSTSSDQAVDELHKCEKGLLLVESHRLIPFLPVLLHQLLSLLPVAPAEDVALSALRTLVGIVDTSVSSGQTESLRNYITHQFRSDAKHSVHDSLCKFLPQLVRPAYADAPTTAALLKQIWFFFEVTVKSMGQFLLDNEKYKLSRTERFNADLLFRIEAMIQTLVPIIVTRHKEIPAETKAANTALAHFMRSCLSLMDRGFIFSLIFFYVDKVDKEDSKGLREYKLDFLQVLSQHEHWLALCLPVLCTNNGLLKKPLVGTEREGKKPEKSASGSSLLQRLLSHVIGSSSSNGCHDADVEVVEDMRLSPGYCQRHFPVGLLLQEVVASLRETKDIRRRTIAIFRNLLAKHSSDPRNMDRTIMGRVCTLYSPLLLLVLENINELKSVRMVTRDGVSPSRDSPKRLTIVGTDAASIPSTTSYSGSQGLAVPPSPILRSDHISNSSHSIPASLASRGHRRTDSLGSSTTITTTNTIQGGGGFVEKLDEREAKDLILCCLFLLRNSPEEVLALFWKQASIPQLSDFLQLLDLSLNLFKYQGKRYTLRKTCNRLRLSKRTLTLTSNYLGMDLNLIGDSMVSSPPFSVLQEANLAQEIGLTVLDCLNSFCRLNRDRMVDLRLPDNKKLIRDSSNLFVKLLMENCSEDLRLHALLSLCNFVTIFTSAFFSDSDTSELLTPLARVLLEQLDSQLSSIQRSAAALLQTLLRASYEASGRSSGLGRLGAQLGVALAHLLGDGRPLPNSPAFHRGLTLLESLGGKEKRTSHFDRLVQELVGQLRGVLTATGALKEAEKDTYRLAELHLRLADSYRGSAVLRQAWLESLGRLHEGRGALSEAAMCHLHIGALMMRNLKTVTKDEWALYALVSDNCPQEEAKDVDGGGIPGYTLDCFTSRMEKVADLLARAQRFESLGPLYRLILPLYERTKDYKALADAYGRLQEAYANALMLQTRQKRALATYFRVIFYGQGVEWIYKEPGRTSLAEATEKLRERCSGILSHDRIKFLAGEELPDTSQGSAEGMAFVQITHVEPCVGSSNYCGEEETDDFQLHSNARKFRFETRFTESEGRLDDVTRQGKRRVYLTCGKSFPYLLSRLPVIGKREETLTPLEVAVEELTKKAKQLQVTLKAQPRDVKGLQLQLQGAVQTTVNAGPLAYGEAFTREEQRRRYGAEGVERLRRAFRFLLKMCAEALEANAELIALDQMEYQKMLVQSFQTLVEKLNKLFSAEMTHSEIQREATSRA